MKTSDFDYSLPETLIAKYPLKNRSSSRLLLLERATGEVSHRHFKDFIDILTAKDLVVFNDTKVIRARLMGQKSSGGKIECLIERILTPNIALAHVRASKAPKIGSTLIFADKINAKVIARDEALYQLEFLSDEPILSLLEQYGELPIPPYFAREAEALDDERYQTVFAKKDGAVAAPTAALHFDQETLTALSAKKVQTAWVTLHVGAGTFQPVRTESLAEHRMHKEYLEVDETVCQKVKETRARGGRIIAIGTTVVRCLETASQSGEIKPFQGDTQLFIYPGYVFKSVDVLLTNFHLPKSTLLMLVCAFGGYNAVLNAYQQAIDNEYRFFSYGDAMLVL